jgi:uroporphyrin-III C-methyltransferase
MPIIPLLSLVGAGPGDPELITLKAINTLATADVVLYDALANEALLQHAPATAIKEFVGKQYGAYKHQQDLINKKIVDYAFSHGHVVRLKGGDPLVFGRAQEEIDAAKAANIPVQIIPGITSALGVPALLGIPPTCRGISDSFWISTGTTSTGDITKDIYLVAQSSATIILLMAMHKLEILTTICMQYRNPETPVTIIQNGSLPHQKTITGRLENICKKATEVNMSNPAIIIIGVVAGFDLKHGKGAFF